MKMCKVRAFFIGKNKIVVIIEYVLGRKMIYGKKICIPFY